MSLDAKLDRIAARAEELRAMLAEGVSGEAYVRASRELSDIEPVVACRSRAIVGSAGATSDCSTAKERPPSESQSTTRVLFACRPVRTVSGAAAGEPAGGVAGGATSEVIEVLST